jgi:co-chaperonin GroES (HSP10)
MGIAEQTLAELGLKEIRPLRRMLFVRTEPFDNKSSGGIYLPGKLHGFFGGLPHMRNVFGTVVAAGPKCEVRVGDRIVFQRLHFAHWKPLREEGAYLGWIDETQVIGYAELDPVFEVRSDVHASAKRAG